MIPGTTYTVFFIWSATLKPYTAIIRYNRLIDFIHSTPSDEVIESEKDGQ